MKHIQHFDNFLKDTVNLNQSRLDILEKRLVTIRKYIADKYNRYKGNSPQGSYAHKTIIKPVQDNDEFDADLLIYLKDDDFSLANFTDYIKEIYDIFKSDKNYADKITKNTRCVTIDYAGDFHLDIVPCVEFNGSYYICNRTDKKYEETDGEGYKEWLAKKNKTSSENTLRKVTRLLKFLRDHKDNFSIKSILLTTLTGNEVRGEFADVPTGLKEISNAVNDFLQKHSEMPIIPNPALASEDFNRNWNSAKYKNFQNKFDLYNQKINDAYDEKDAQESVKKWRMVFGDDFGKPSPNNGGSNSGRNSAAKISPVVIPTVPATKPYSNATDN